jgi:hypothetical protein
MIFGFHRSTPALMRNVLALMLLRALVLTSAATVSTILQTHQSHVPIPRRESIITIPLIPHHIQVRRQRERLLLTLSTETKERTAEEDFGSDDVVAVFDADRRTERALRPHHYPRSLQDPQNAAAASENTVQDPIDAKQMAALYHGYGTHYADLWCGTPTPQRQTVIVDTGSGSTAFPCSECRDCGVPDYHIDALYQEFDSTSFTSLTCNDCLKGICEHRATGTSNAADGRCAIGMSYQEGSSWSAYEALDTCYVGGLHSLAIPTTKSHGTDDDLDPFHAPAFAFPLKFGCQTKLTGLFRTQLADGMYVQSDNGRIA